MAFHNINRSFFCHKNDRGLLLSGSLYMILYCNILTLSLSAHRSTPLYNSKVHSEHTLPTFGCIFRLKLRTHPASLSSTCTNTGIFYEPHSNATASAQNKSLSHNPRRSDAHFGYKFVPLVVCARDTRRQKLLRKIPMLFKVVATPSRRPMIFDACAQY